LVGDDFDVAEIERVFQYIRTNQLIYDILTTVADLMDCVSADRFEAVESVEELQKRAYELNQNKLFLAALNLEDVALKQSSYRLHMDTDNTQPTFESRNRFWFPGPADSMVIDLKYHRGFVQLKQMVDLGIIKYKRNETGFAPEADPLESGRSLSSLFSIKQVDNDEEDDDDFDLSLEGSGAEQATQKVSPLAEDQDSTTMPSEEGGVEVTTEEERVTTEQLAVNGEPDLLLLNNDDVLKRSKRQGIFDLLGGLGGSGDASKKNKFEVDNMQFYTKQFPYPAFLNDV